MAKDPRYKTIRLLLAAGQLESFADIFNYIPKTKVANDLGLNVNRFSLSIENVENFRIRDIYELARLCDLPARDIFELIDKQYKLTKGKDKK